MRAAERRIARYSDDQHPYVEFFGYRHVGEQSANRKIGRLCSTLKRHYTIAATCLLYARKQPSVASLPAQGMNREHGDASSANSVLVAATVSGRSNVIG